MTRYINRDHFINQLKEALAEAYPNDEYRNKKQFVLKESVRNKMDKYIHSRYGEYDTQEFQLILEESRNLLSECLEELGMNK